MITDLKIYHREWKRKEKAADPEGIAEKRRERRLANYAKVREQERASRERNREKRNVYAKEYAKRYRLNKEHYSKIRRKQVLSKYGLTLETFNKHLSDQGHVCAICQMDTDKWHIDHCHYTGRYRGILCQNCNLMLGHARENPAILALGIEYYQKLDMFEENNGE